VINQIWEAMYERDPLRGPSLKRSRLYCGAEASEIELGSNKVRIVWLATRD